METFILYPAGYDGRSRAERRVETGQSRPLVGEREERGAPAQREMRPGTRIGEYGVNDGGVVVARASARAIGLGETLHRDL